MLKEFLPKLYAKKEKLQEILDINLATQQDKGYI